MIKDIIFNFLDYIEERFEITSKELELVMDYPTYIDFYREISSEYPNKLCWQDDRKIETFYGMPVRKDEGAPTGFMYLSKGDIILGVIKVF